MHNKTAGKLRSAASNAYQSWLIKYWMSPGKRDIRKRFPETDRQAVSNPRHSGRLQ